MDRKVVKVVALTAALMMAVLPNVQAGEEDFFAAEDTLESAKERKVRVKLMKYLGLDPGDLVLVVLSEDLASGEFWENSKIDPLNFTKYQVIKADFPNTQEVAYYVRKIGSEYYFSVFPQFLFGDPKDVLLSEKVMDRTKFLERSQKIESTPRAGK
jgi:hypothetical protein